MPAIQIPRGAASGRRPAAAMANATAIPAGIIPPRVAAGCGRAFGIVLFSLLTAIAMLIATLVILPSNSIAARAAGVPATQAPIGAETNPLAGLFFPSGPDGAAFEAPQLSSDVRITVTGMIARVALRQRFTNPSDSWQEGIYVFPLPEKSAVDRLTMTVGDRVIAGEILEKEEAKRVYDAAAAAGQRASLLSSERPNVFVTSVANIGPGEEIVIDIEYQDSALYRDGTFSLRFPMVVAPRYSPLEEAPKERPQTVDGETLKPRLEPAAFEAEDRDLFGPVGERSNPVTLSLRLDPGHELASLASLYHPIDVETLDERQKVITLREGSVPANKDFVLEWRLASDGAPQAAVFTEEYQGESYVMMMVTPPLPTEHPEGLGNTLGEEIVTPIPARDVVFVIDTSGSMHGASIEQAQAALSLAISRLQPQDRFNVIRFDNETYSLFHRMLPVTADSLRRAQAYVNALQADGGTEMRPALLQALAMNAETDEDPAGDAEGEDRLKQVVFLTDGAVGNEAELFKLIAEKLGATRLFTVGIGAAPNSYFMRKAAEAGRGSFTYIGDPNEVEAKMSALLRKLERPALTDIALGWPAAAGKLIESYPSTVPDLYQGEPVVVVAKVGEVELADLGGRMLISGRQGSESWQRRASLDDRIEADGIAALWARSKFEEITDGLYLGRDRVAVRADALQVALTHQLVTRYTSLVAIDEQPARPQEENLQSREVPRELPEGWDRDKVFGGEIAPEPEPAGQRALAPAPANAQKVAMRSRQLPASISGMAASASGQAVQLPRTATPATLNAIIGSILLLLGGLLFAVLKLRKGGAGEHV